MVEGLMRTRGIMISIMRGTIDVAVGMAGGGEEAMEAGVAARSETEEATLGKGPGEVVTMAVEEGMEEDMVDMEVVEDTAAGMAVGTNIGGIEPGEVMI